MLLSVYRFRPRGKPRKPRTLKDYFYSPKLFRGSRHKFATSRPRSSASIAVFWVAVVLILWLIFRAVSGQPFHF